MNMHITEAGQLPTQAQIIAIQIRLGKNAKSEKVARPRLLWIRPEPIEHVKAWEAWQTTQNERTRPMEYIKAMCIIHGVPLEKIHRRRGTQYVVSIRDLIIQSTAARYPRLSSTQLGKLFKRDHTSILYCLWKTRGKRYQYKSNMTLEKATEIRRRSAAGEMGKDIAASFGVSSSTVSLIIRNKTWSAEMLAGVAA
jgi:hypothetical protein